MVGFNFLRVLLLVPIYFFLTLYIPILMCIENKLKRNHFKKRVMIVFILTLIISLFISSILIKPFRSTIILNTIRYLSIYIFLFIFTVFSIGFCFSIKLKLLIFWSFTGYAIKNLGEYLFFLLLLWITHSDAKTSYKNYIFGLGIILITSLVVYYFIIKETKKKAINEKPSNSILIVSAFALILSITLNLINNINNDNNIYSQSIILIFSFFSSLLIVLLYSGILEKHNIEYEMMMMQLVWKEKEKYLNISKKNSELINVKYHDVIKQLNSIHKNETIVDTLLSEFKTAFNSYSSIVTTGSSTLDIILNKYILFCTHNSISFSYIVDGKIVDFMSSTDITVLFENAIENAIEAVMKLPSTERFISLNVLQKKYFMTINIENQYLGKIQIIENFPVTTKTDKRYHGFGTKSINLIVKKYNGDIVIDTNEEIYSLRIVIPLITELNM